MTPAEAAYSKCSSPASSIARTAPTVIFKIFNQGIFFKKMGFNELSFSFPASILRMWYNPDRMQLHRFL